MKIQCPSCNAKYSVPDEKLAGRSIKIRCKRCSNAIYVDPLPAAAAEPAHAHAHAPAPSMPPVVDDTPWTVAFADDDQRQLMSADITAGLASGALGPEVLVWRDPMPEWLPIASVHEFAVALASLGARAQAPSAFQPYQPVQSELTAAPPPSVPPPPAADDGSAWEDGATVIQPAPVASSPRVESAAALFGRASAPQPAPAPAPAPVSQRPPPPGRGLPPPPRRGEAPASMRAPAGQQASLDDIMRLGPAVPSHGAPILDPNAPPPAPPAPVVEQVPVPARAAAPATFEPPPAPKKSATGFVFGALAALAVLGAGSFVALRSLELGPFAKTEAAEPASSSAGAASTASAAASDAAPVVSASAEPTPAPEATAEAAPSADPLASASASAEPDVASPASTPLDPVAAKALREAREAKDKAAREAKEKEKDAKEKALAEAQLAEKAKADAAKSTNTSASGAGKDFNAGAANAAMGGAAGAAKSCKKPGGPTGQAKVRVTFGPSGSASSVGVTGSLAGTPVGNCVAGVFKGVRVPAFEGKPVSMSKTVSIN